jgi:hypothetical protein
VAALLLLALIAAGAIVYAIQHERGVRPASFSDAAKNQRIIDRLTPYPGSHQTRKFVRRSYGGYGQGLLPGQEAGSHSTTIVYSLPAEVKAKRIAAFYGGQLHGWERQREGEVFPCETDRGPCFASFTKGEAMVSLNFDRRHKTYLLIVDHRGAANSYSGGGGD